MKTIRFLVVSAALGLFAGPVLAHHSHATIDTDDVRMYSGVVVKYGWTMPHVYLKVNAPNDKGEIVEYSIEMQHPPAMKALGWSRDTWKPGDRITWQGAHDKDKNRAYTSLRYAERADGTRIGAEKGAAEDAATLGQGRVHPQTDGTVVEGKADEGMNKGAAKDTAKEQNVHGRAMVWPTKVRPDRAALLARLKEQHS